MLIRIGIILVALLTGGLLGFGPPAWAEVEQQTMVLSSGTELRYSVVIPPGYDGSGPMRAILAFAHGPQKSSQVDWGIRHYWGPEAEKRGYLVFSPEAPGGELFFEGGETIIPEFIARLNILYEILDHKFHVVGFSNGGMSALQVAALYPEHFTSVLALSGYFWAPSQRKYMALRELCVVLIAGNTDVQWADGARRDHSELIKLGQPAYLEILPRSAISSGRYADEKAGELFDLIEGGAGCPAM